MFRTLNWLVASCALCLGLAMPGAVSAGILGANVDYDTAFATGASFDSGSFVVAVGGPEVNNTSFGSGSAFTIDFEDTSFTLGVDLGAIFGFIGDDVVWTFTNITPNPTITSVVQTSGPTAVSVGWTGDSITIRTPDFFKPPQANTYTFDVVTSAAVPEPASMTIVGLGAVGLVAGAIRRRRQQKAAV